MARTAKIVDNVAAILDLYPPARDNNNLLIALYWQACEGILIPGDLANKIAEATSAETIVRAKREIIEQRTKRIHSKEELKKLLNTLEEAKHTNGEA